MSFNRFKRNLFGKSFLGLLLSFIALLPVSGHKVAAGKISDFAVDLCIYGATPGGIMAACAAKSEGKTVLLVEPSKRIGGMTAGGLGWTDLYHPDEILKGYSQKFYQRIAAYYGQSGIKTTFEPKVALAVFNRFLKEAGIHDVLYQHRIIDVLKTGNHIDQIVLENAQMPALHTVKVSAKVFMDCSYEGDLMGRSGVSYVIGRESNDTYGETKNGVQMLKKHQFPDGVDPYVVKGDSTSGLLWGIMPGKIGASGQGDKHVQAYNFRLTLTSDPNNMIPIASQPPANYDPKRYELLIRMKDIDPWKTYEDCLKWSKMPNYKCDMNNQGAFSTDMIGNSWAYPEASYAEREKIYQEHLDYTLGLLYFMWTDERIPVNIRTSLAKWGWPKDEFIDSNHITPQLYVRESRRMVGRMVMTQKFCEGKAIVDDPIGWADYTMDSHNCGRYVVNGMVKNEGDVQVHISSPYRVSYRAVTPKESEASNLLVPVCLSASHIAFGSIRMEPVYMVLGETCALAACEAIDNHHSIVQQVDSKVVMTKFEARIAQMNSVSEIK